ncbi:MAG: hypothetical protein FWE91_05515 [Defluviitaleaceae bacterium]|nr:hypothetical protein [Defluviitaleaceae bacterium]MCL2836143.1 hypothetical protein [Defluviitaleaceae bacterium]
MINEKICEWLLENADAPIRYRVARELLIDYKLAKKIENDLLENVSVQFWMNKLKPQNPPQSNNMAHGSLDYFLENAMIKLTQLGLRAEFPRVADAARYYLEIMRNALLIKPFRKHCYCTGLDLIITSNMLTLGGFKDDKALQYMMGGLNELYEFARKGDCDIYLSPEERDKLKGVPPNYIGRHFTRPDLYDEHGMCWPLLYDVIGLTKLYGLCGPETDKKIDTVIDFISNDDFHNTIPDGYGVLVTKGRTKYYSHGWDPKYPGWFGVDEYIQNSANRSAHGSKSTGFVPKLLFFAIFIAAYPAALKTQWFAALLSRLNKYKTEDGTFLFPKEWLVEKTGYAVLGNHMSFGENRRKRNWLEIESTFYMQLLYQVAIKATLTLGG